MSWTQSRDECVSMGGHLVIINSQAEQVSMVIAERLQDFNFFNSSNISMFRSYMFQYPLVVSGLITYCIDSLYNLYKASLQALPLIVNSIFSNDCLFVCLFVYVRSSSPLKPRSPIG